VNRGRKKQLQQAESKRRNAEAEVVELKNQLKNEVITRDRDGERTRQHEQQLQQAEREKKFAESTRKGAETQVLDLQNQLLQCQMQAEETKVKLKVMIKELTCLGVLSQDIVMEYQVHSLKCHFAQ